MSPPSLIRESINVHAPLARCFALSTRVELVQKTLGMKLAGGVTTGHITANSRVVWRGWKFGLLTRHHTLITAFAPPHAGRPGDGVTEFEGQQVAWFEDSQERGRFATFRHEHLFRQQQHGVLLEDHIHFELPLGFMGQLAAKLLLAPHICRLARQRFAMIKELAEGDGWRAWVDET
jgi:ligand-binding SRPBCC domain-containing protein